jgi:hypothetical protein
METFLYTAGMQATIILISGRYPLFVNSHIMVPCQYSLLWEVRIADGTL